MVSGDSKDPLVSVLGKEFHLVSVCSPGYLVEGSFVLYMWRFALLMSGFQYRYVISHSLKIFDIEVIFSHVENLPQDCHGQPC